MPATQTSASERKFAGASPAHRNHTAPGKLHKQGRNGSVSTPERKDPATMRNNMPPALKISMRSRNGVHVDLMTLPKGVCLLDDESKLLKAIGDLFPVVSGLKGFEDNKRWNVNSTVAEVFHTFLHKIYGLVKCEQMKIVMKNDAYHFLVKEAVYFDVDCPVMPVYWIPQLKKVNKRDLYELCFYLVVFMTHTCHVDMWQEDSDSWIYYNLKDNCDHYIRQSADLSEDSKRDMEKYKLSVIEFAAKGVASVFYDKVQRAGSSKKIWLREFESYKPRTQMEKDIYRWLAIGRELVKDGHTMHRYISLPDEFAQDEDGDRYDELPVTPDQVVKFLWRVDDAFSYEFISGVESQNQSSGGVPFYCEKMIEKPTDFKLLKTSFPETLLEFMAEGRKLEKKYRNVWEDEKKLAKALFKPKPLLEIL